MHKSASATRDPRHPGGRRAQAPRLSLRRGPRAACPSVRRARRQRLNRGSLVRFRSWAPHERRILSHLQTSTRSVPSLRSRLAVVGLSELFPPEPRTRHQARQTRRRRRGCLYFLVVATQVGLWFTMALQFPAGEGLPPAPAVRVFSSPRSRPPTTVPRQ
jgi:hypothetical protein